MQYNWKLFKWNGANDRTELTKYLVAPVFLELRCNEQLSSGQVTLDGVPTSEYNIPFPPKTKITVERWVNGQLDKYYDFCVDHDEVEHFSGCPNICCHRVHLIEPSVFAQGLNCDNFALTYELNDVNLNYKTVISDDEKAVVRKSDDIIGSAPERPNWNYGGENYTPYGVAWWNNRGNYTVYYTNGYIYRWTETESLNGLFNKNLNGLVEHDIKFTMPLLKCYWNNGGTVATELFDCPVRCNVYQTTLQNGSIISGTRRLIRSQLYSPSTVQNSIDRIMYNEDGRVGLLTTSTGGYTNIAPSSGSSRNVAKVFRESEISKLPAMISLEGANHSSREVSFTTTALTAEELARKLSYNYEMSFIIEPYQSGAFVQQYTVKCVAAYTPPRIIIPIILEFNGEMKYTITMDSLVQPSVSACSASVSFVCRDMFEEAPSNPFLAKGEPYNCFNLFRKAMLTCDTQIFDNEQIGLDERYDSDNNDIGIQYPIEVSYDDSNGDWMLRMKEAIMYESVFENKNLWEVLQQIGHYLHAIPYLEFARNGKDRFVLKFKQLGGSKCKNNDSSKLTVFNSQTLDNFFTQYDSYVTNLFSPQNEIDEWLTCKTSDGSYLVSNNTAELHTKYNITELIAFDIRYNGVTQSALDYVFEKSIYNTLSSKTDFVPAKWSALYFEIGTSKIQGLNYVPPTPNNDGYMALKTIVGRVFNNNVPDAELHFNDLSFHVRYKTQDTLRITQLRPDLERFVKSSEYEKYPHHEQFFGQQDKIIDSERFSANLWGKLIRVANGIYQCQEYAAYGQEKEPGDLVELYGDSYYVTECESECYPDAVFQKVTYSKNFNQLSNIVTIPSEPRFYEVSERSVIRREVRLLDFIKLSTEPNTAVLRPKYINAVKWHEFIRNLLFADMGNAQLPNYAYTNFKGDRLRNHYNLDDRDVLYPSSEAASTADGTVEPRASAAHRAVIVPLLHFPLRNAIVFEWDMDDNFKAADCKDITTSGYTGSNKTADEAYQALQPVRYCDIYGRADLFDFKLFYKDDWTNNQINRLPFAEENDFTPTAEESTVLVPDNLSIGLDKDNREALSFNYQLNLLHEPHDTDTEDFIIFPNLFGTKNNRLKVVLLRNTVSMFDEAVKIDMLTSVADEANGDISYSFENMENGIKLNFALSADIDISEVKSIVFYDTEGNDKYAHLAKNVAQLPNTVEDKLKSWWLYHVFN